MIDVSLKSSAIGAALSNSSPFNCARLVLLLRLRMNSCTLLIAPFIFLVSSPSSCLSSLSRQLPSSISLLISLSRTVGGYIFSINLREVVASRYSLSVPSKRCGTNGRRYIAVNNDIAAVNILFIRNNVVSAMSKHLKRWPAPHKKMKSANNTSSSITRLVARLVTLGYLHRLHNI